MAFDGLLLHALTKELNHQLNGGRIDKIYQPARALLLFHIRRQGETQRLLISAAADGARIHTTNDSLANPLQPPAFCMLLRKYLEGGRIGGFKQQGLERIVTIEIETFDEFGEPTTRLLQCELMGKHSNVLLLNNNMQIVDSLKRFSAATNQYREVLPGIPYTPPPAQDKVNPFELTEDTFTETLFRMELNTSVDKALLAVLSGFSPQSCKEVVARAGLPPSLELDECGQHELVRLWQALAGMLAAVTGRVYKPTLVKIDGHYKKFSPFDLTVDSGHKEHYPTLNRALDQFYRAKRQEQQVRELRHFLQVKVEKEIARLTKKISINEQKLADASAAEKMRLYGELITANIYRMKRGQKELIAEDFYTGKTVTIPLKTSLTPSENAQRYFKRYQKARQGGKIAAAFLKNARLELNYLESVAQAITACDSLADLQEIKKELAAAGIVEQKTVQKARKKTKEQPRSQPRRYLSSNGIPILVGKNNRQNDRITLKTANPEHLWLHVKDIPGSHVIIQAADVPQQTLAEAAVLAAFYSKAQNSANVPVDYTLIKHVRKPRGAKPGMVIYDHQKTLFVTPDPALVKKLSQSSPALS